MLSLFAILAQDTYTRVGDRVGEEVSTAKRTATAGLAVALLGGTAYGLAVVATAILLSQRYGAVPALFGLAGGFLLVALIVLAALVVKNRRERELRRIRREQRAARRDLMTAAATLAARKPLAATGIALALDYLFARRRD